MCLYYGVFGILVLFNFVFNDDKPTHHSYYWIGRNIRYQHIHSKYILYCDIFRIVPELPWIHLELQSHQIQGSPRVGRVHLRFNITFNSSRKEDQKDQKRRHQPSFMRQVLYSVLMVILMTGLVCMIAPDNHLLTIIMKADCGYSGQNAGSRIPPCQECPRPGV